MEAFYKMAYDIGCYYAVVAFFLAYSGKYEVNPFSFLVFFAACFFATCAEKFGRFQPAVRVGAFVLPVIPFLLESNIWGKVILLLPWTYLVVTVLRESYDVSYRRFKKIYLTIFWVYVAVFAFFVGDNLVKGEVAMIVTVPFLVILLVAGVFLMQMLRFQAGSADKKKLEKHQHRQLVAFMIAAVVLTVGNLVEFLYDYVFFPLSKLVFGAIAGLAVYVVGLFDGKKELPEREEFNWEVKEFMEELEKIRENTETIWGKIPEKVQTEMVYKDLDYTPFFILCIAIAVIIIFAILLGSASKKKKAPAIEDEREDCYDEVAVHKELKKRFVRPEIVIRYYYREFMKKSEAKKHRLEASDTTKEILTKYKTWNNVTPERTAEAEEVTLLYQKTRYSKEEMTRTDAKRMKALVKGL